MGETTFELAGAELDWPIGSAAGLTNHPSIEVVASRLQDIASSGVSFAVAGSWTLGEARGGNAFEPTATGWDYRGGDEYVDLATSAGYNAKGLPGPGTDAGMARLDDLIDLTRSRNVELALSLSPHSGEPLKELEEIMAVARAALRAGVLYVEINLSCPNVLDRPPFYRDVEGIAAFHDMVRRQDFFLNRLGQPGIYPKYGPLERQEFSLIYWERVASFGGKVISNTLGNQEPMRPDGMPAVRVNNGKAGMSGPALRELGREQLALWAEDAEHAGGQELISVLGIGSGEEVKHRIDKGAAAIQLASVLYWPALIDCSTAAEAVEKIKQQFVVASQP